MKLVGRIEVREKTRLRTYLCCNFVVAAYISHFQKRFSSLVYNLVVVFRLCMLTGFVLETWLLLS